MTTWKSWHFNPRDPLVFDSGARIAPPQSPVLPPQSSVAGCVRGAFFEAASPPLTSEDDRRRYAKRLLEIELRGPWYVGPGDHPLDRLLVPCPSDLGRTAPSTHAEVDEVHLVSAGFHSLDSDDGLHLPGDGAAPRHLFALPAKSKDGAKIHGLGDFVISLRYAVQIALSHPSLAEIRPRRPFQAEHRTHVQLNPETLTAEPEQLFVSRGRRLHPDLMLSVDVATPPDLTYPDPKVVFLGGEGRPSTLKIDGAIWPSFETVRENYELAIDQLAASPLALRLALLTPGDFGGSIPPPLSDPDGRPLDLLASCHDRYLSLSGWDLRARSPRPVRRLVPAGAVYLYKLPSHTKPDLLNLCRHFWGRPLHIAERAANSTLAAPQHDGYALALPGLIPTA